MPRGGARVGSGRKPNPPAAPANVIPMRAAAAPPDGGPVPPASGEVVHPPPGHPADPIAPLLTPPDDLDEDLAAIWRKFAPSAIEVGTLVEATAPGFRELVELYALKQAIGAHLRKVKQLHSKRNEGHLRTYLKLSQRLDVSLGRFKLTAFGKPVDGGRGGIPKKEPANPWGGLDE